MAEVNCTTQEGGQLCDIFKVRGYPTLLFLPVGESDFRAFSGKRNYNELKEFAVEGGWQNVAVKQQQSTGEYLMKEYFKPVISKFMT